MKNRERNVLKNYSSLEQKYNIFKTRYNYYHTIKVILEIIFILLGTLATVIPVILSSFDFLEMKITHVLVISGGLESLITVVLSKILNEKLIQSTKNQMIKKKEIKDKLFNFYMKAMEDDPTGSGANEISLVEMIEIRKIIHQ